MPNKIIKVRGALGCGKTTWLVNKTEELMKRDGTASVAYLAYTRAARKSIQEKLHYKLGLTCTHTEKKPNCKEVPWVGTFHSICSQLVGVKQENVITLVKKLSFEKISPLEYLANLDEQKTETLDEEANMLGDKPRGNAALKIISRCRVRKLPLNKWKEVVNPEDLISLHFREETLTTFREAWEGWKTKNALLDFEDILSATLSSKLRPVTMKHFMVDEFQDLYPLIYDVYAMWRDETPGEVYFGGDEHQTIYRHLGAREDTFLKEPHDELVQLNVNYRCPEKIWGLAKKIVRPMQRYNIDEIRADKPGGEIVHHFSPDFKKLLPNPNETTLYLADTNKQINAIYKQLLYLGIPTRYTGMNGSLSEEFVHAYNAASKSHPERRSPTLQSEEVRQAILHTPAKAFLQKNVKTKMKEGLMKHEDWTLPEFYATFQGIKQPTTNYAWQEWVNHLKISELQRAFANGRHFVTVGSIEALSGTAHSGKGLTSDRVVLFNQMPWSVKKRWPADERDKRYLYHMAVGRAAKRLDVVHGKDPYPFF